MRWLGERHSRFFSRRVTFVQYVSKLTWTNCHFVSTELERKINRGYSAQTYVGLLAWIQFKQTNEARPFVSTDWIVVAIFYIQFLLKENSGILPLRPQLMLVISNLFYSIFYPLLTFLSSFIKRCICRQELTRWYTDLHNFGWRWTKTIRRQWILSSQIPTYSSLPRIQPNFIVRNGFQL